MDRERFDELKDAFVLGALPEEERREFEEYLAAHPERQAEIDELAALAGLLALAPQEHEPSPALRRSIMAAVETEAVDRAAHDSSLWSKYAEEIDRESAREKLGARMAQAAEAAEQPERDAPAPRAERKKKSDDNAVLGYLKSREGRSMMSTVARGVFGLLRKRR